MRSFTRFFVACALLSAAVGAYAGEAGKVVFVTGGVQRGAAKIALNDAIQEGDEIRTAGDGYVYIKTVDNGFLILRPNSLARVDAYRIDMAHPENSRVKLELLQGVARSISGEGVKKARQNFRFNTPVAAIGVRGTDFVVHTDQQTSRVSVQSGGIVMSPFNQGCGPEGAGPCEGGSSRELFAGQSDALLQVVRGQHVPQLIRASSLQADPNVAPRSDEPVVKPTAAVTAPLGTVDVNLEPQKGVPQVASKPPVSEPTTAPPIVVTTPPTTPVVETPPVTTPTLPATPSTPAPSTPEVFWGRWSVVASTPADKGIGDKIAANMQTSAVYVGPYVMGRLNDSTLVMPKDGTAAFTFESGEAVMQRAGKADAIGAIENGRLNIDFAGRTFSTSLDVVAGADRVPVVGTGTVSSSGALDSNALSPSIIRGFLGGSQAQEAGYLFKDSSVPNTVVMGATKWTR